MPHFTRPFLCLIDSALPDTELKLTQIAQYRLKILNCFIIYFSDLTKI